MTPHKCPICRGNGIVPKGFYTATGESWISDGIAEACRACTGTGIVWEKLSGEFKITYPPNTIVHHCKIGTAGVCSKCGFRPEGQ